jgi:hypothetical protein
VAARTRSAGASGIWSCNLAVELRRTFAAGEDAAASPHGKDLREVPQVIYFSDVFNVEPDVVGAYGAFNIVLLNNLPLSIEWASS